MVDVEKIQKLLGKHFVIEGQARVDPITGVVDVDGGIMLKSKVSHLLIRFGHVTGSFYCNHNQLSALEGAPGHVGGDFNCYNNQLTTLKGAPGHVGGDFVCSLNQLTTLEGAPGHVGGGFYCNNNSLATLDHAPKEVGGDFSCWGNRLSTLDGAPDHVGGDFEVDSSSLLPLLRLLQYNHIHVANAPEVVTQILNKYAGTGKKGSLAAAVELARAGYKDNARW